MKRLLTLLLLLPALAQAHGGVARYLWQANTLNMRNDSQTIYMGASDDVRTSRLAAGSMGIWNATSANGNLSVAQITLTGGVEPACNLTNRGVQVHVYGGVGVADTLRVCMKGSADTYAYQPVAVAP